MRSLLVGLGVVISSLVALGLSAQAPDAGAAFVLRVDSQGSFFLPGAATPVDDSSVVAQAAAALTRDADVALVVESDAAAPDQRVTRAAVLLQEAGARKIAFRTRNTDQQ